MKNASKTRRARLKNLAFLIAIFFAFILNPYTLVKDIEEYLWQSVAYRNSSIFPNLNVRIALILGAEGTFVDKDGNSALDMAAHVNNIQGVNMIKHLFDCKALLKSRDIALRRRNEDIISTLQNEYIDRCDPKDQPLNRRE